MKYSMGTGLDNRLDRKGWVILSGLILLAMAFRLFIWFWTKASFLGDMIHYIDVAKNLGSGHLLDAIGPMAPPLYPLLIQAGYLVIGDYDLSARLISVIFGGLLVYPVFRLADLIYGRATAVLAGAFIVPAGELITYSLQGYAESAYLFFITMAVYKTAEAIKFPSQRGLFVVGLTFGLAALTKGQTVAFFGFSLFYIVVILLFESRRLDLRIAVGILLVMVGYGVMVAPYMMLLHEKTGQWMLNPKQAVLASVAFHYRGETMRTMYALKRDSMGRYYTNADIVYAGQEVAAGTASMSGRPMSLNEVVSAYLSELGYHIVKGVPSMSQKLLPMVLVFFLLSLMKRRWDLRLEGYLLSVMAVNILLAGMYVWNPRYHSTMMPLMLILSAHGVVRNGSLLGGIVWRRFRTPHYFSLKSWGWVMMTVLSLVILTMGLVQLLHKKQDQAYISRVEHQKKVAITLRDRLGSDFRIMSWGIGRSAVPFYMGVKQSQVRTVPMAPMEAVLQYARQEDVRLLIFDTEEVSPGRFPGLIELLKSRGVWPGLQLVLMSPRGRNAIFVYKVL